MLEFFHALNDPNIPFLRYALLTGILASVAFGIMGTYVVVRRISYIAGAISHSVLGGIGAAFYLQNAMGWDWVHPMLGALVAALLSALIIGLVSLYAKQREDTVIGAIWAIGMAIGLLFLAKTPGYVDPMSYLFGNILLISKGDLWLVVGLDCLILGVILFCYQTFLAVFFDEEHCRLRGIRTQFYYLLLLCLTALTIVLLVRVVGIVMVIALLTLPSAVAAHFSRSMGQMMLLSVGFCMVFVLTGMGVSYTQNLPTGPVIILLAGLVYLLVTLALQWLRKPD
ncbi:MAG: metal ABC transporter permease [bacterium]|jgi:zinc transport system permease protein|nr:metal ABC transporter permease [bacterium]